jgi:hypothetical protein
VAGYVYVEPAISSAIRAVDTADGSFIQQIVAAGDTGRWIYFEFIRPAKATQWTLALGQNSSFDWGTASIYFDDLSITDVVGNHAVQATTANKPAVARGPKKFGANLREGFTLRSIGAPAPATYNPLTGQGTCNRVDLSNQSSIWLTGLNLNSTYWVSIQNTGSSPLSVRANTGAIIRVNVNAGETFNGQFVPSVAADLTIQANNNASSPAFTVHSVQEITEFSNVLRFDSSSGGDLLSLGRAVLNGANDHWVSAVFSVNAIGAEQAVFAVTNTTNNTPRVAHISIAPTTGEARAIWLNDGASLRQLVGPRCVVGKPVVVTAARISGQCYLWVDGVLAASGAAPTGIFTTNTATIGSLVRTSVQFPLNGDLYDLAFAQATLTEADRKTIEAAMARKIGVTLP